MNQRSLAALPLLFGLAGHAQDYLAHNPVWRLHSSCADPYPCVAQDDYTYRTAGDTLIDGTVWTKLVREGSVTRAWFGAPPTPQDCQGTLAYGPGAHGTTLIRQAGRQLRILDSGADQLLYEFDLHPGDTLSASWNHWGSAVTVTGVDSILVGTEMRARYALGNSWAEYLIEGVGSSHGLLEPLTEFLECGYSLECFGLDTAGFYPEVDGVPCAISTGMAAAPAPVRASAFPNPGTGEFTLVMPPGAHDIRLCDATGRQLIRQRAHGERATVNTQGLPAGLYLVCVDDAAIPMRWVKE